MSGFTVRLQGRAGGADSAQKRAAWACFQGGFRIEHELVVIIHLMLITIMAVRRVVGENGFIGFAHGRFVIQTLVMRFAPNDAITYGMLVAKGVVAFEFHFHGIKVVVILLCSKSMR